jgi:hypothetical protein
MLADLIKAVDELINQNRKNQFREWAPSPTAGT